MARSQAALTAIIVFILAAALHAQSEKLPMYGARRTIDAIRIDGKLDEASWGLAPRAREFRHIYDPARRSKYPTEAAIVWDDDHIYVAFDCIDPEPWGTKTNRDDRLWEEEVVEVFLDPDGDGLNYAELEVSPNNVVVDLLLPRPKSDVEQALRWNIEGLKTAVGLHPAGWMAEIAIPWKSLGAAGVRAAPMVKDQWRVGLFRIKRPGGIAKADRIAALVAGSSTADVGRKEAIERELQELRATDDYLAWSLTRAERGFHDPARFGVVQFLR
jgi:hypothetical protein